MKKNTVFTVWIFSDFQEELKNRHWWQYDLCCMTISTRRPKTISPTPRTFDVCVRVCVAIMQKSKCNEFNLIADNRRQLCHRWLYWWWRWCWPLHDAIDYRAIMLWHEFHFALIAILSIRFGVSINVHVCTKFWKGNKIWRVVVVFPGDFHRFWIGKKKM